MRISIIGTGYVGTVLGVGLADLGHDITLVDVLEEKVDLINQGKAPIYEKGLSELIDKNKDKIKATTNLKEAVINSQATFIAVGTPSRKDGSMNMEYILSASKEIGQAIKEKEEKHYIIIKSTVLPGTTEQSLELIEQNSGKKHSVGFSILFNPEFLREGLAVWDFFNQDRIVLGSTDNNIINKVKEIYSGLNSPILETKFKEAEMIKYTSNSLLATKISFINEIGNICKKLGIDTNVVAKGAGMDKRIGPHFLKSGIGFGGSCFPKDVSAIAYKAKEKGYNPRLLNAVLDVNKEQPAKLLEILDNKIGNLKGKNITILGLAFKEDTDDLRESPSIQVIKELLLEQANLFLYDPIALKNAKKLYPGLNYLDNSQEAIEKSDIILLLTEWPEFSKLDYGDKLVIDGKNIFDLEKISQRPKNYEGICW